MDPRVFAALGEPNRLRIVELLAAAPRSVGEIAIRTGLRQPQVTKHLQTLERVGLVAVHPLAQRRIYALRREAFRDLAGWAAGFELDLPTERVLAQFQAAIEAEQRLVDQGRAPSRRVFEFERRLAAKPERVWRAWTSADEARRWWAPEHFRVAEAVVEPIVGGTLRIVMEEGDGRRSTAVGRFLALDRPRSMAFELAPVDEAGQPYFSGLQEVTLEPRDGSTLLSLRITVSDAASTAAPVIAGIELGWPQLLDGLARHLAPPSAPLPGGEGTDE